MLGFSCSAMTDRAWLSSWSRACPSCPQVLSTAPRSMPTRYQPLGNRAARARINSRTWRRRRLRTTADPMRRGVENATRTPPAAGSRAIRRDSESSRTTRLRWNGLKPLRRGMRPITPTNGRDPWSGATSRRRDHPWSSSACEIRAFLHADACWVGRYVSRLSPDVTYKAIGSNALQARGVCEPRQRRLTGINDPHTATCTYRTPSL